MVGDPGQVRVLGHLRHGRGTGRVLEDSKGPSSKRFTRGFLVVAPGLTIRDRLRVLQPNDLPRIYARRNIALKSYMTYPPLSCK
jgi:hypothetical protein